MAMHLCKNTLAKKDKDGYMKERKGRMWEGIEHGKDRWKQVFMKKM